MKRYLASVVAFALLAGAASPTFAAWSLVASGTAAKANNTNTTALNVAYPAGCSSGNILLLAVRGKDAGTTFTLSDITTNLASQTTQGNLILNAKIATGSESGNMTVSESSSGEVFARIFCFSGGPATLTGIVHASNTSAASSGTGLTYPAITITQANTLVIVMGGKNANVTSYTANATVPNVLENDTSSNISSFTADYVVQTTATNLSAGSWTISGDSSAAQNTMSVSLLSGGGSPPTFSVSPAIGTRTTSSIPITATTACSDCTMYGIEQTAGAAAPTVAQIKAGQDHTGAAAFNTCTVSPTANVSATCTFGSITDGTVKDGYFALHSTANGDIASAASIANMYKIPAFSSGPTFSSCSAVGCTYSATLDGAGTIYGVACLKGSTAATVTQVEAGQCTGGAAAQASANTSGTSLTIGAALSLPIYDFSIVGTYGSQHEASTHADSARLLTAPSGKQYEILASVSATSFCNSISSPAVAVPDIVKIDSATTPGANAITMQTDCNLSFPSDGSRQTAQYDIYDDSAQGFMAGGPGTLVFNNQAPVCPPDNSTVFVYPVNTAISPATDLTGQCTDPEGDAITYGHVDALPTGISISANTQSGTPTVGGSYANVTLSATDAYGAVTQFKTTYLIGNMTVPNVVNEGVSQAIIDVQAQYLSFSLSSAPSKTVAAGNVISESPSAGSSVVPYSTVALTVSSGNPATGIRPGMSLGIGLIR